MKRILTVVSIATALLLSMQACYKDYGNYDYTTEDIYSSNWKSTSGAIRISPDMRTNPTNPAVSPFIFSVGEQVVVPAKYEIMDKTLNESDIRFEWYYGGELYSTEKTFVLDNCPTGRYTGMLVLTDTRYNQQYPSDFSFDVNEAYSSGWAMISEKDGESHLSYLYIDPTAEDQASSFILYKDVYASANNGAKLAPGVTHLTAHGYSCYPQIFAINIVQPGEEGPIDLNAHNMSVMGHIRNEFMAGASSVDFKEIIYKQDNVYALATDGSVYVRREETYGFSDYVPHTGVFPTSPITGIKVFHWTDTTPVSSDMSAQCPVVIAYDENSKGCVQLSGYQATPMGDDFFINSYEAHRGGPGFDGTNEYPDITYPDPGDLSGYKVLKMNCCGFDADWLAMEQSLSVVMLLQRESDGKLFFYSFRYFNSWGTIDIDLDLFFPVPDNIPMDPATMITGDLVGGPDNIIFFTGTGNKDLYFFNAITGAIKKFYTAPAQITAFHSGEIQNPMAALGFGDWTQYAEKFVVATSDGKVRVLKMSRTDRASGNSSELYSFNSDLGPVTKIAFQSDSFQSL